MAQVRHGRERGDVLVRGAATGDLQAVRSGGGGDAQQPVIPPQRVTSTWRQSTEPAAAIRSK